MVAHPTSTILSVEEYLAFERQSSDKHEYVDGRLYAMAGGTSAHDRIGNNVRTALDTYFGDGPCAVHGPDMRLRTSPTIYYYPDAFVTCDEVIDPTADELTTARLVVEVLSDSTEAKDRGDKFANYQTLPAVEEYVLVDGRQRAVERFRRAANNLWTYQRYGPQDTVTLESIGLVVPVAALYRNSML